MDFKDALEKVDEYEREVKKRTDKWDNENLKREVILAKTVKLGEEVGELNDEILKQLGFLREGKVALRENLEDEFGDVLITLFGVSKSLGVDLEKAFFNKVQKVIDREKSYR